MKKNVPELLARFNQIKDISLLSYVNTSKTSMNERELLEKLFEMGDNDFHSLNGIPIDTQKVKGIFLDSASSGIKNMKMIKENLYSR